MITPPSDRVRPVVPRPPEPPTVVERLARYLELLLAPGWFGSVTIGVQNGRVSTVKTEQTKRLEEL